MRSTQVLEEKFVKADAGRLQQNERKNLLALLELERGAAALLDGERIAGLRHIMLSLWLKPRLHGSLQSFWERSAAVPDDVVEIYEDMQANKLVSRDE